jgi:cell division inhibitor SepF
MPVRSDGVVGQVAEAARHRRPLFRVTVSPRLARFMVAAGARPATRTDDAAEGSFSVIPAASAGRWREVAVVPRSSAGGAMRKMAVYLGLVEDHRRLDDQYQDEYDECGAELEQDEYGQEPALPDGPAGSQAGDRRITGRAQPDDLAEITTLHPRTIGEARTIGEHFREGTPVLMDLTEMDDSDAKRLVDFSAGLIFGLGGSIKQVSSKVFLLSPANVVAEEDAAVSHESQA